MTFELNHGENVITFIDWVEYDRLRATGLSIQSCAKEMGVAKGTLIRRAWERAHGRVYKGKEGERPRHPPAAEVETYSPSPPRRFSWER